MFSTTKTLTKTLMMAATLTLVGACDADPEAADFGAGDDVAFRPVVGGIKLNTSFIGGFEFSELDTNFGAPHHGAILVKTCVQYKKEPICLDKVWVEDGEIFGRKGIMDFKGPDFMNSTWSLKLDYDADGTFDSSIDTKIISITQKFTPNGDKYVAYGFSYVPISASGLISKYVEVKDAPVPVCEIDVDTNSLEAVVIKDLTVDLKSGDMKYRPSTLQIACESSATGKAPSWGYIYHQLGVKVYETVVRMIRADYCGDGVSWTEPGNALQVEDIIGLNKFGDPNAKDEAFWVVGGAAACLNIPREASIDYDTVFAHCGIELCKDDATMADYSAEFQTKLTP